MVPLNLSRARSEVHLTIAYTRCSPNQVLTHAARTASGCKAANSATSGGRARRARRALVRATHSERVAAKQLNLPCAHGPSRAASSMLP